MPCTTNQLGRLSPTEMEQLYFPFPDDIAERVERALTSPNPWSSGPRVADRLYLSAAYWADIKAYLRKEDDVHSGQLSLKFPKPASGYTREELEDMEAQYVEDVLTAVPAQPTFNDLYYGQPFPQEEE